MSLSDPRMRQDLGRVNETPHWPQGPELLPNPGLLEVAEASLVPGPSHPTLPQAALGSFQMAHCLSPVSWVSSTSLRLRLEALILNGTDIPFSHLD